MNNNQLVLLDAILGVILLPLCLLIKSLKRAILRLLRLQARGILVVKFLGAGNIISVQGFIEENQCDLLTARSNLSAINFFGIGKKKYLIDDSNFLSLVFSSMTCVLSILFSNYKTVINLETESKFAKFLTAICSAELTLGITNTHKAFLDAWLYDRYLVNPLMISKLDVLGQLGEFQPLTNEAVKRSLDLHRENFLKNFKLGSRLKTIVLSPSCSNTDQLRRLDASRWEVVVLEMMNAFRPEHIVAIFPSKADPQYFDFEKLQKKHPGLELKITTYNEFVNEIKNSELLITVDSQALHIGQHFRKNVVAIYGPTSPYGVLLGNATYPISRSLVCSPCTHKYLELPCGGQSQCMSFKEDELKIFINSENAHAGDE